jgi:putative membrane protein insertion efficiency factor
MNYKKLLAKPFIWVIRLYQLVLSPILPNACRFSPTCSQYGIEAFKKHGAFKGLILTVKRISRCHPWGGHGHDPVP